MSGQIENHRWFSILICHAWNFEFSRNHSSYRRTIVQFFRCCSTICFGQISWRTRSDEYLQKCSRWTAKIQRRISRWNAFEIIDISWRINHDPVFFPCLYVRLNNNKQNRIVFVFLFQIVTKTFTFPHGFCFGFSFCSKYRRSSSMSNLFGHSPRS